MQDISGNTYSTLLVNPDFERKLRMFDSTLKLMFDQGSRRWCVLEPMANNKWKCLLKSEDKEGNAKPLGDWVINQLFVWRHNAEARNDNPNKFLDGLIWEQEKQRAELERKQSEEHQYRLKHDINDWRRAANELAGKPTSDVTAGYPGVSKNNKETT